MNSLQYFQWGQPPSFVTILWHGEADHNLKPWNSASVALWQLIKRSVWSGQWRLLLKLMLTWVICIDWIGILNHLASYCLHRREGKSRAGSGAWGMLGTWASWCVPLNSSFTVPRGGSAGLTRPVPDIPPAISQLKISPKILLIIGLSFKYIWTQGNFQVIFTKTMHKHAYGFIPKLTLSYYMTSFSDCMILRNS